MAMLAIKKPQQMRLSGVKWMLWCRRAGKTTKSMIGIRIMRVSGFRLLIISFGTPLRVMVEACETRLWPIWP